MNVALFYDQNLPYEGVRPELQMISDDSGFELVNAENFNEKFKGEYDCIINLHGSHFPEAMWKHIKKHLKMGGGLVNVGGGIPFSYPLVYRNSQWVQERQQTAYHEELNIIFAHKVKKESFQRLEAISEIPLLSGYEQCFEVQDTLGMVVQFTKLKDSPLDAGSSGPMDAVIKPLITGISGDNRPTAAPVVLVENFKGDYAGGRWIFINQNTTLTFWKSGGMKLLETLGKYTASKAWELVLRTNYACYYPGEQPMLLVQGQYFGKSAVKAKLYVSIMKEETEAFIKEMEFDLQYQPLYWSFPLDIRIEKGIYKVRFEVKVGNELQRSWINGFWGYDRELLESGSRLTCGRDYFLKDGKPMPVVGMTYMQPDVHRKYLYLPNVALWDRDFEEMARAGINMVRTGIWTAHRSVMFNDGIASEEILRMLDAMFLTAAKHDLPLVFNFFAFTPETWEGSNPYLDIRSIQAQKRFISSIVSRHAKSAGILWDLINEPSVCNPRSLWHPYPNRDKCELDAWRSWLKEKHKDIGELCRKWNCSVEEAPDFEYIALPEDIELNDRKDFPEHRRGLKFHDYVLFTQQIFLQWVQEMTKAIRASGAPQLITVGQDEALHSKRPSPLIYQEAVDYTTNHSWWLMDDLYWDGIFCKSPDKPNLIQETGTMYIPNLDNRARRSEEDLRNILERKYAMAFASNNAGAVQWIWNTNIYMDSINEVNIGALRADGSHKPEAAVSYDFGKFFREIAWMFEDRKEEEIVVIYPYSNDFSLKDYVNEATKKLSRILAYDLGIHFKVLSEYDLRFRGNEKLILLPSARTLSQEAWEILLKRVKDGCSLLVTGVFSQDEYWRDLNVRKSQLGLGTAIMPVNREELLYLDDVVLRASFGQKKIAWVDKELCTGEDKACVKCIPYGKGKVLWSPLPMEMNDMDQSIAALYTWAIRIAGISGEIQWITEKKPGVLMKKLAFRHGTVYILVSESGEAADIHFKDSTLEKVYRLKLPSGRIAMFAVDGKGQVLRSYRDMPVEE